MYFKFDLVGNYDCNFLFLWTFFVDPKNKKGVNQVLIIIRNLKKEKRKNKNFDKWNRCVKTQIIKKG